DVYNKRMAKDERLAPIAQQINFLHHRDESRHLAFGRLHLKNLFETWSPSWSPETRQGLDEYLKNYLTTTWKEYYNPAVYKAGAHENQLYLQEETLKSKFTKAYRREFSSGCIRFLHDIGIFTEPPQL